MEVAEEEAVEEGACDCPRAQDEHFRWMGVLRGQTEGGRVLVVDLVDVFVEASGMEGLMGCIQKTYQHPSDITMKNKLPRKWKKSSKTKQNATWIAIVVSEGKGTS